MMSVWSFIRPLQEPALVVNLPNSSLTVLTFIEALWSSSIVSLGFRSLIAKEFFLSVLLMDVPDTENPSAELDVMKIAILYFVLYNRICRLPGIAVGASDTNPVSSSVSW